MSAWTKASSSSLSVSSWLRASSSLSALPAPVCRSSWRSSRSGCCSARKGPGGIEFDDSELARRVGMVGLALILYEGGLQTSWRRLRQVAVPAALLSTVGVVVSALLTGVAAYVLFDLSWLESVLLGAVVAATDAAAVFATLRSTHIRRTLARTLEAESGGNDPMGIALTLGLIAWIERPNSLRDRRPPGAHRAADRARAPRRRRVRRGRNLGLRAAPTLDRRVRAGRLGSRRRALLRCGGRDPRQRFPGGLPRRPGSRQHSVTVPAAARRLPRGARLPRPGRDLRRLRPARLSERAAGRGTTRPGSGVAPDARDQSGRSVGVDALGFRLHEVRTALLGWAGLRGAVPIVLATFVLSADVPHKDTIFNAVFFVVVVSTIVQGSTLEWVAGRLGLLAPAPLLHEPPLEVGHLSKLDLVDFVVAPRPRDQRLGRPRARTPPKRADRGDQPRRRHDSTAGKHRRGGRRPTLRRSSRASAARISRTSSRAGGGASSSRRRRSGAARASRRR